MVAQESRRRSPKPRAISPASPISERGGSIARTCRLLGIKLWPWQRGGARVVLSRAGDRWRYAVVVVIVPRQSGKTLWDLVLCIDRCLEQPGAQVWYTAQSRMDAVYRWRELVRLLRSSPLREAPRHGWPARDQWDYRVRGAAGAEEVEFSNGSQLRVFAPQEDSLHGSVSDLVVLDEARFLDERHGLGLMAAVLPTQATRDGQVILSSTAGGPESVFLARQVEAARAQLEVPGARTALIEYGIDAGVSVSGGELLRAIWRAHPSAGQPGGLLRDALEVAGDAMPAWQLAHEYGNRWRTAADVRVLPAVAWAATVHDGELPAGRVAFAADIPPDRSEAAICACSAGVVEVVDILSAVEVPRRLLELSESWNPSAIAIDAAGPAGTVADQLRPIYDRLVVTSTRDLQVACAGWHDALLAGTAGHRPNLVLDTAAASAVKRPLGQAWAWSRVDGGSILVAASLAWWAEQRAPALEVEPSQIW